jgi:hypothetical protein
MTSSFAPCFGTMKAIRVLGVKDEDQGAEEEDLEDDDTDVVLLNAQRGG